MINTDHKSHKPEVQISPDTPSFTIQKELQLQAMATPSPVRLVFGAGGIGEGAITHAWTTGEQTSELLDVLKELELTELDSAASAPPGNPRVSERLLGESQAAGKEFVIDTKIRADSHQWWIIRGCD